MNRITATVIGCFFATTIIGCATAPPISSGKDDSLRKEFSDPIDGKAGLYIYRNTWQGRGLTKAIRIDGEEIGSIHNKTYFYKYLDPGTHTVATRSEFGNYNSVKVDMSAGNSYFVRHYIKMGVFSGGADVKLVSNEEGKKGVLECKLLE